MLASSCLFFPDVLADTIVLKNEKKIKGLVVEKHADRIILSTEKGEVPILLKGIKEIQYDDPEQNFMQVGRAYEAERKYGEALAYYEKALELNPSFEDARKAAVAVRNRFWAATTEGPKSEMERQQALYDSWDQGRPMEEIQKNAIKEDLKFLREGLGISIERRGDWVYVSQVLAKKDAAQAGLRKGDRLVSMDGESLRYLSAEVVAKKMILPRYSNFTLEYERGCFVRRDENGNVPKDLGVRWKLEYQGVVVEKIKKGLPAEMAGLREKDLVVSVNNKSTRYMPLAQMEKMIRGSKASSVSITVRRAALLTRR